jgi:hypothetical protein
MTITPMLWARVWSRSRSKFCPGNASGSETPAVGFRRL